MLHIHQSNQASGQPEVYTQRCGSWKQAGHAIKAYTRHSSSQQHGVAADKALHLMPAAHEKHCVRQTWGRHAAYRLVRSDTTSASGTAASCCQLVRRGSSWQQRFATLTAEAQEILKPSNTCPSCRAQELLPAAAIPPAHFCKKMHRHRQVCRSATMI